MFLKPICLLIYLLSMLSHSMSTIITYKVHSIICFIFSSFFSFTFVSYIPHPH
ncbi:hypothetical protein BDF20DRAFT_865813 [Mycotypha africana]|uniref:uncharacterized protein n=1 Tax=Mycotypha africana TaxID=64632 RepID=UPI0023012C07|nr:uncharacterized protein BDF20DRAFT_865813 [Mycotypha africana]KAI8982253.1 hypothetical protein BDF20DRAFT_865813 [Mycotypha africana]